jgi:DNA polymerase-3 subunit epsilon
LAVLDLESTGLNPRYDRIVEVAVVKVHPDGRQEEYLRRVNPERPISSGALEVHGITDADVADAPAFRDIAGELFGFLRGCDLAGFGILTFDLPLLAAEFARVGITLDPRTRVVDSKNVFHKKEPRTLSAALSFYCGTEHDEAHAALGDAKATYEVLVAQMDRYPDLPADVGALAEYCNPTVPDAVDPDGRLKWAGGEIIVNFGQKTGISLRELAENEPGYLRWILNKDFSPEVKAVVRDALDGKYPEPPGRQEEGEPT